jgi:catecholate siderophore receptor
VRITENGVTYMGGDKEVNGLELGFNGRVLSGLNVFGGYTYMESEQKNAGAGSAANGMPFINTPKHSFSLWTTYKPMARLTLGVGVFAQSSVNQGYVRSTVDGGIVTKGVPGYARYDAMLGYEINRNTTLQLNAYNLADKVYYSGVRSPHYATLAPGRSAVVSVKFTY